MLMRFALAMVLLLAMPIAAAVPDAVHLGIPSAEAGTTRSAVWHETAPARASWTVTLEGPDGSREVKARVVDGPSVGTVYEAVFDQLAPNATYTYAIDERRFEFRTPPAAPSAERPIRIVALGDMGISDDARATVEAIATLAPDLILHAGDISYAEGRQPEWDTWFAMVEPIAASIPWVTALGNHETYSGSGIAGLIGLPSPLEISYYQQRFSLPGEELAYSFEWAGIHIVALDTFSSMEIPLDEPRWLEQDLAANQGAAWTIAFLHEPPWSSNEHGSSARVQRAFVPAFESGGVDLVLAAHDHGYERSVPTNGVTYIVSGGGGAELYTEWAEPAPEWSAFRDAKHHVTVLDIYPDRIEGWTVGTAGDTLADTFTIEPAAFAGASTSDDDAATPALSIPLVMVAVAILAWARRR